MLIILQQEFTNFVSLLNILYMYNTENGGKNISFVFNYRPDEDEVKVEKADEAENTVVLETQPIIDSPLSSSISVNKQIRPFDIDNNHTFK